MKNTLKIATWNVGGAKFLKEKSKGRNEIRQRISRGMNMLLNTFDPDIILLQEIIKFEEDRKIQDLMITPDGYFYDASMAIDTHMQTHPLKWDTYRNLGNWKTEDYLGQGLGILWKKGLPHASVWSSDAAVSPLIEKEIVRIETGLYDGDRDTEPRLAVVTHFVLDKEKNETREIFVINCHLSSLKGEREGFPDKDDLGSEIRLTQLKLILNGIVSRCNTWRHLRESSEKKNAIWIIAGDFNCTPDSPEIRKLKQMNFVDLNSRKGQGTKGKGYPQNAPSITVDYIFGGPLHHAFESEMIENCISENPEPDYNTTGSDHYPVIADVIV